MRRPETLHSHLLRHVMTVMAVLVVSLGITQHVLLSFHLFRQATDDVRRRTQIAVAAAQEIASSGGAPLDADLLIHTLGITNSAVRIWDSQGAELAAVTGMEEGLSPWNRETTEHRTRVDSLVRAASLQQAKTRIVDGRRWLVVVSALPSPDRAGSPAFIEVWQPLKKEEGTMHFFEGFTVAAGVLGLLLAAWTARHLMSVSLRPLTRLVETATAIAGGDWERRVPPSGSQEIDEAASAFNRMVDRLQAAFDAERAQQERMRRFLSDAAHELRTPLTALNGFIELMQTGAVSDPETQQRALSAMRSEGERMARLVRDLLQITRLDNSEPGSLPMAELDLGELLEGMHALLSASDPDHPIELEVNGPAPIWGNEDGLKQMIWNLVDNARRFSPPGQPVLITCRSTADRVYLAVADRGCGIPPEDLPHVFDRFWRGDASRQGASGGTGLGLSIVKAWVEAHSGEVDIKSEVGRGTTVDMAFPRADVKAAEQ